jgi:hypothetical protein
MTVDHLHVRAIAVEAYELVGAVTKAGVIVARHANVRVEPRKAAGSAVETFRNGRHE